MNNEKSPFDLTGRVVVVTGGNGGIGRAIALGLARAGAAVAILARNPDKNQRVLAELLRIGVPAMASHFDVTDRAEFATAIGLVEQQLGAIDVLVNNAGLGVLSGGVLNENIETWDKTLETNLTSCFRLSQIVAKAMVHRKSGGKIINLGSMYSIFGSALVPSYSASKGAVIQLTKSMAIELAPHNIQVNAIAPGWIETDMTKDVRASPMNDLIVARTPANRWGQADELAGAAVFLASAASDFITGVTLPVDGGYSVF